MDTRHGRSTVNITRPIETALASGGRVQSEPSSERSRATPTGHRCLQIRSAGTPPRRTQCGAAGRSWAFVAQGKPRGGRATHPGSFTLASCRLAESMSEEMSAPWKMELRLRRCTLISKLRHGSPKENESKLNQSGDAGNNVLARSSTRKKGSEVRFSEARKSIYPARPLKWLGFSSLASTRFSRAVAAGKWWRASPQVQRCAECTSRWRICHAKRAAAPISMLSFMRPQRSRHAPVTA